MCGRFALTASTLDLENFFEVTAPFDLVAKALSRDCFDVLGLNEKLLNVEFTQHAGDEMYHPSLGGFSPEWTALEADESRQ